MRAAIFEIPHFNIVSAGLKIDSHCARARAMQAVIVEYRDAVDKQHAAIVARHREGVSATFVDEELSLVFRREVISRRTFPESFLPAHIVEALHDPLGIGRSVEIDLIEIAQRMTDIEV